MLDAERFMDHLHHRRQTIGGAGRSGDDPVHARIIGLIVDAHHHVQHTIFFHRRGHHHALHALIQIGLQYGFGFHLAGSFDHHIAVRPVGVGDGFVVTDGNALAIDRHHGIAGPGFPMPAAMYRIEIQQMRQGCGIAGRIVDADDTSLRIFGGNAHDQAPDATETVDADA